MEILENLKFSHEYWEILLPLFLMVFDVITGYYNAWKNNNTSSSKMRDGIGKKLAEIVYIVVGIILGYAFDMKVIGYFISIYIAYMELVSIAENCKKLGVEAPKEIMDKLNNDDKEGE